MKMLLIFVSLGMLSAQSAYGWRVRTVDRGNVGVDTSIVVDKKRRPHIAYYDKWRGDLKYARKAKGRWRITRVDIQGHVGEEASLQLDSRGRPHVGYGVGDPSIAVKYAALGDQGWTVQTVERRSNDESVGLQSSLALDASDQPHLSYTHEEAGGPRYAFFDGRAWQYESIERLEDSLDTAIALDRSMSPHVVYGLEKGGRVKHAYRGASGWQIETVDRATRTGEDIEMRIDGNDIIHVIYKNYEKDSLKYARKRAGGGWRRQTIARKNVLKDLGLAVDRDGRPYVVYSDSDTDRLRVVYRKGGKWKGETVTRTNSADGEIAVDSRGGIHVSFRNEKARSLMYAYKPGRR